MHETVFTRDGHAGHPAAGGSDGMVAEILERIRKRVLRGETWGEVVHHGHVGEVEAAWGAGIEVVVVHWEMAVAIGVGARGSNVRGIKDVCIDKIELIDR